LHEKRKAEIVKVVTGKMFKSSDDMEKRIASLQKKELKNVVM